MTHRDPPPAAPAEPEHDALVARVREVLDERERDLDAAALGRLREARARAVDAAVTRGDSRSSWRGLAVPAGAFASVVLTVVALVLLGTGPERARPGPVATADVEMLAAPDDLELYRDLEFFIWLDAVPRKG